MKNMIKLVLDELINLFGDAVFQDPEQFKSSLETALEKQKITPIEAKRTRNLLGIAIIEMDVYSRIKTAIAKREYYIIDRLVLEMDKNFDIKRKSAEIVIKSIAEMFDTRSVEKKEIPAEVGKMPSIGDTVQFSDYTWKVIDTKDKYALILSEKLIEKRWYHDKPVSTTWEQCSLRKYLNGMFYNTFSAEEKSRIKLTKLENSNNPWFNTKGGKATMDRVFILSVEEIVKYFGDSGKLTQSVGAEFMLSDEYNDNRIAYDMDSKVSWWWLRTPGNSEGDAAYIYIDGHIVVMGIYTGYSGGGGGGIRPALWLSF